jgi:tetratricopeptide (TPR) repeat protein
MTAQRRRGGGAAAAAAAGASGGGNENAVECSHSLMRSSRVFFLAFIFGLFSLSLCDRYDDLCDAIVKYAQLAAIERNKKNEAQAAKYAASARSSFISAIKEDDNEAQAYVNYAQFLFNMNRPDESLEYWQQARKRTNPNDQGQSETGSNIDVISWIDSRIALAKYAHYSMQRDTVYSRGQGNITKALKWAEKQFEVYGSPSILFEMATMEVWLTFPHGAGLRNLTLFPSAPHNTAKG